MPARGFHYSGTPGARKLTPKQVMKLAAKYGLPAKGIMQIAKGESGLDAAVQQRDPGDGMVGYGLLQMTPNAWGAAGRAHLAKLGGVKALSDPEVNMQMARYLYKQAGNSFKPWYGTRYLTDRSGEGTLRPVNPNARISGVGGGGGTTPMGARNGTSASVRPSVAELLSTLGTQDAQPVAPAVLRASPLALSAQAPMAVAPTPAGYVAPSQYVTPGQDKPDYLAALDALQTQQQAATVEGGGGAGGGGNDGGGGTSRRNSGGPNVKGELYELIWRGPGSQTVKNGQAVDRNFYTKHEDHVHVGARQKDILKLGKLAQSMGLHVGENPAFGGVDPVHVGGSFHYGRHEKKGENDRAIDVSGDVAAMKKFARLVRQAYRV